MDHKEIRNAERSVDNLPGTPSGRDSPDFPAVWLATSSSTSPGLVQRLIAVAKDNYKTAFITIIIVLIILLETTLDNALFKCPCSTKGQNIAYAVIFVVWPSVTLLILGNIFFGIFEGLSQEKIIFSQNSLNLGKFYRVWEHQIFKTY